MQEQPDALIELIQHLFKMRANTANLTAAWGDAHTIQIRIFPTVQCPTQALDPIDIYTLEDVPSGVVVKSAQGLQLEFRAKEALVLKALWDAQERIIPITEIQHLSKSTSIESTNQSLAVVRRKFRNAHMLIPFESVRNHGYRWKSQP